MLESRNCKGCFYITLTFYLVNLGGGGQRFEKYMPFYYGDFDIFINAIYNGKWYVYV